MQTISSNLYNELKRIVNLETKQLTKKYIGNIEISSLDLARLYYQDQLNFQNIFTSYKLSSGKIRTLNYNKTLTNKQIQERIKKIENLRDIYSNLKKTKQLKPSI